MVKILESMTVEVVEDPKLEVDDKSELGPEIVAELVSLQEEIFSRPTEVVELPIETLIYIFQQSLLWSRAYYGANTIFDSYEDLIIIKIA